MANLNFDASTVEAAGFDTLPAGAYNVVITDSAIMPNKAGNGHYLSLTFEIINGEYTGRRMWERLNIDHPNEMAVKIARQTLAAICRAAGLTRIEDSSELHDLPIIAQVTVKKDAYGEDRNEIKGYRAAEHTRPAAPQHDAYMRPTPPPQTSANGGTTSPWAR